MDKIKLERILNQYQTGKITLGKAAELAGYPLRVMLKLAVARKIPFQYTKSKKYSNLILAFVYTNALNNKFENLVHLVYSGENLKQDFKAARN